MLGIEISSKPSGTCKIIPFGLIITRLSPIMNLPSELQSLRNVVPFEIFVIFPFWTGSTYVYVICIIFCA